LKQSDDPNQAIRTQPVLIFERVRSLWPRHPQLISDVMMLAGWPGKVAAVNADRSASSSRLRCVDDRPDQMALLEARAADHRNSERNIEPLSVSGLRDAGVSFSQIVWVLSSLAPTDGKIRRRLRLWSADCVARVLHLFESVHPHDARVRDVIIAARKYARAEIDNLERQRAGVLAAQDFARRDTAGMVAAAATFLARERDSWADNVAAGYARSAASVSSPDPIDATEVEWQFLRLVDWMSAEQPEDWPLPVMSSSSMPKSPACGHCEVTGNIPSRLDDFTGREDALSDLNGLLTHSDRIAENRIVIIRGAIGKTELAIEHLHRFASSYSGIWWCSAENRERLAESLAALGGRLKGTLLGSISSDELTEHPLKTLGACQPPFLLVFDHVTRLDHLPACLLSSGIRCIVTTDRNLEGTSELLLENLPNKIAAAFLQRKAGMTDQSGAEEIARLENCNLSVLRSIAGDCRRSGVGFREWLEMDASYQPHCRSPRLSHRRKGAGAQDVDGSC
jgi:immunity protein 5 of polymorphic toxin system